MRQKSIITVLITAVLAVFCNCAWMPVSHACCKPDTALKPNHSANHSYVCCQDKATVTALSANQSEPITVDDWINPPAGQNHALLLSLVDPHFQSLESQAFIKDQSKRRCLELCVLLN